LKKKILVIILVIISFGNIYTLLPRELNEIVSKDSMIKNIKKIEISYPNQEKNIVVIDKKSDIEKVVDYLIQKKVSKYLGFSSPFKDNENVIISVFLNDGPVNTISTSYILWYNTEQIKKDNGFNVFLLQSHVFYKLKNEIDLEALSKILE